MKKLLLLLILSGALAPFGQAQITCPNPPTVSIVASNTSPCQGEAITLTASGANTYSWNNNVMNGQSFVPAASGNYEVIGTDSNGCSDTAFVAINVLPLPQLVANSSSLSICLGDSIQLTATGANSYNWITPAISNGDFFLPSDTGANTFVVEGTGTNGCINNSQVIVVVKPTPAPPSLSATSLSTCRDVAFDEELRATPSVGRAVWFGDAERNRQLTTEPVLTLRNDVVGVTTFYAMSFHQGCYSDPTAAAVEVFALPTISAGSDFSLLAGERGRLNGQADAGTDVEWLSADELSTPFALDPEFTATNSNVFTLQVTDANNCVSTDAVQLTVKNTLVISNVMTPNGDGNNDVWKVYPESVLQSCKVMVFDGFGRIVLERDNYQNDWDGTYEGSALPDGDYYYHIQSDEVDEKGTLVIIK
ncbi:MAG: gliding motility-associated C-terminal domain-containing protein [Salibacteraceae bacterium]